MARCISKLVIAAALGMAAPCDVDLTSRGLPACVQACEDWCWATVIGEFEEYYHASPLLRLGSMPGVTPKCRQDECKVVSSVMGTDCCQGEPGGCRSGKAPCGLPMLPENITQELQRRIPSVGRWQYHAGIPAESAVAALLTAGHPIGRINPGHISAIVGCRPGKTGQTEYRIVDSTMVDPQHGNWFANYTMMMELPFAPDLAVRGVIYADGAHASIVI
mmetsp:Transcript_46675/g.117429  ORF Transcript_46675/g.117429 Transcript_46675/m.117429 type:complete len:219 (-) Transcript_46675:190-846(-)|eukprot:CAMPEP_0115273834 /NCGR_PEP_ID=MMETSP0270-20121206/55354_1 /TAXON_ID=71861 /ORGANISM="Scrippsiella trochoidea, Strain CCMP3099" /LENGTH=218 /DNA_ID=CAMNT_0002690307 /DNA_START=61 /DNA_END=717 /DNA_ORIENTATION=+